MKVTGIIAEYNPFHKGHAYHIQKAKELTGADYIIVVMKSGDFTQRGMPALLDKYTRARMALPAGPISWSWSCRSASPVPVRNFLPGELFLCWMAGSGGFALLRK